MSCRLDLVSWATQSSSSSTSGEVVTEDRGVIKGLRLSLGDGGVLVLGGGLMSSSSSSWMVVGVEGWMVDWSGGGLEDVEEEEEEAWTSSIDWGGEDSTSSLTKFSHFFINHLFRSRIATAKVVATAHAKNPIKINWSIVINLLINF